MAGGSNSLEQNETNNDHDNKKDPTLLGIVKSQFSMTPVSRDQQKDASRQPLRCYT